MTAINVYSKEQVDDKLADKQGTLTAGANIIIDANNVISSTGGGGGGSYVAGAGISISGQTISNAAIPDVDKAYVDAGLALKPDTADVYTKTQADTLLALKADKSTTYTKTEVDTALALKADKATTYTKTEVDNLLPDADELVPDYSGASAGDVLTIENGAPAWKAGGSGEILEFTSWTDFLAWADASAKAGDVVEYLYAKLTNSTYNESYILVVNWLIDTLDPVTGAKHRGPCVGSRRVSNMASGNSFATRCSVVEASGTDSLSIDGGTTYTVTAAEIVSIKARVRVS